MDNIISFLAASILLTLAPGPDIIFVATQSISSGKWAGIYTAMGLCTGLIIHTILIVFGVSAIINESEIAFLILKYIGAAYLFYLAYLSFKRENFELDIDHDMVVNKLNLYKQGVIMNLLNPKVILFFLAFLPQFIVKDYIDIRIQLAALGMLFIIQAFIIFTTVSIFADYFRNQLISNIFFTKYIGFIKGMVLILLGLKLTF